MREGRVSPPPSSGRCGLRPAAAPGRGVAGQLARAVVAEIRLLRAATRIREIETHRRAFSFRHFLAAVVADEHCLACQLDPPRSSGLPLGKERLNEYYAALRARRIRCERSKLSTDCSSGSSSTSLAPNTRKW